MISAIDRVRIAAQATICERTVRRAYAGRASEYSRARVTQGAQALGLPAPPPKAPREGAATTATRATRA